MHAEVAMRGRGVNGLAFAPALRGPRRDARLRLPFLLGPSLCQDPSAMQAGEGRGACKCCMRTDTKVAQVARAPVPRTTSRAVIRPSLTWEATARAGPRTQSDNSQDGVSYLQDPLEGATGPVIGRDGLHMPGLIFRASVAWDTNHRTDKWVNSLQHLCNDVVFNPVLTCSSMTF
ncbi:MAG: hypothetical protein ACPIOQ_52230, partial [Promethearchaeia archaeon]